MSSLNVPIKIKRGTGVPANGSLKRGELAYSEDLNKLYIGTGNEVGGFAPSVDELLTPATVLEDLANVSIASGPSDGDVLTYDGTAGEWTSQAVAAAAWADITGKPSTFTPSAHNHTVALEMSGLIESPEAKAYVLSPSVPSAITITNIKAQTSAGTVDVKLQDDGVDITDTTLNDVGTSLASPVSEPNAAVASGSKLTLVVSDPQSSPADLAFTVHYSVTSANN